MIASARSKRSPGLGTSASMSMSFAVLVKRTPATAMVMTPMTMKASPAQLAKRSPCAASWRSESCGADR